MQSAIQAVAQKKHSNGSRATPLSLSADTSIAHPLGNVRFGRLTVVAGDARSRTRVPAALISERERESGTLPSLGQVSLAIARALENEEKQKRSPIMLRRAQLFYVYVFVLCEPRLCFVLFCFDVCLLQQSGAVQPEALGTCSAVEFEQKIVKLWKI